MVAMVAATFSIDFDCKGSNLVLILCIFVGDQDDASDDGDDFESDDELVMMLRVMMNQ